MINRQLEPGSVGFRPAIGLMALYLLCTQPAMAAPPAGDTAVSTTGDIASKETAAQIAALENRLNSALRYIQGLHRELLTLKGQPVRGGASATAPGIPGGTGPSAHGPASGPPLPTVAAGPSVAPGFVAPSARPRKTVLEERASSKESDRPDRSSAFLRQARAVLLRKGTLEIEPSITVSATSRNQLLVRGLDIIEAVFIGDIRVERVKRNTLVSELQLRYGITNRVQVDVSVPYLRSEVRSSLPPAIQRVRDDRQFETTRSGAALGDVKVGLSYHLFPESDWLPDMIGSLRFKTTTGTAPWDVDRDNEVATGSGFWSLETGATLVKVTDPAVLFTSLSYRYTARERDIPFTGDVDPGDAISWGAGMSYALNPMLSITTRFQTQFTTKIEIDGRRVDGSELITSMLSLGATYRAGRRNSLEFLFGIGLGDDSPDFSIQISTPLTLRLPPISFEAFRRPLRSWRFWR